VRELKNENRSVQWLSNDSEMLEREKYASFAKTGKPGGFGKNAILEMALKARDV